MNDVLSTICNTKKAHIQQQKRHISEQTLLIHLKDAPPVRPFYRSLNDKARLHQTALITEVKKASPSKGIIREDFDPAAIAQAYEEAGATCISVLTDTPYFQGKDAYLKAVRAAVTLPVLRKDFMLDSYQVLESRALGADCILLIMAALSDAQARELEQAAMELGMDVLIEVHDQAELERALTLKSPLIGINNRNLKTLEVNLSTSENMAGMIPADSYTVVCESGIRNLQDIKRMHQAGLYCFLVGESLMREPDIIQATRALLGS